MVGCFARCREREGVRETGRRDDETENDWERLRMAGKRANETTGQRDHGTAGLRDHETTRLRDYGTTGQRDNETTGLLKKTQAFTGVHRRSQTFSGILSRARQCVAVRGSLASEGCRCGAKSKFGWMGVYLGVHSHSDERAWCRRCATITTRAWRQKGAECYTRQKCRRWVVLERTSH